MDIRRNLTNLSISKPENPVVFAKIAYFAGKIRIGEYLKRIGLINVDQLETAMRIQKENEMANVKKGFASILVDLNLVTRNDTDKILLLKQESKRRFVLNFNNNENEPAFLSKENQNLQYIERLEYENKLLKTKLRELLNLGKK